MSMATCCSVCQSIAVFYMELLGDDFEVSRKIMTGEKKYARNQSNLVENKGFQTKGREHLIKMSKFVETHLLKISV